mgnify:CR=1 FL=1
MAPMADTGDDVGCMFRYQNADNYYRLTMDSRFGCTRLEKKVSGQFLTLSVNTTGYEIGQTYHIEIEIIQSKIFVYIDGNLVFAVEDASLASGSFAFYGVAEVHFDNLFIEEAHSSPTIGLFYPLSNTVVVEPSFYVSAIGANEADGYVDFLLDAIVVDRVIAPPYMTEFSHVGQVNHPIEVVLYDNAGFAASFDLNVNVGVDGDYLLAAGDSITSGNGDNYSTDNLDPANPSLSFRGYTGPLGQLLEDSYQYPALVANEGIGGDKSSDLANLRIDSILERHPGLNRMLMLIGTNDPMSTMFPSRSAFAANVQDTVDTVHALDSTTKVTVGIPPPAFG